MADGIESFNEQKNLARVAAGFKGSEYFNSFKLTPDMPFIEGWPRESIEKYMPGVIPQPTPIDTWNQRRKR